MGILVEYWEDGEWVRQRLENGVGWYHETDEDWEEQHGVREAGEIVITDDESNVLLRLPKQYVQLVEIYAGK